MDQQKTATSDQKKGRKTSTYDISTHYSMQNL